MENTCRYSSFQNVMSLTLCAQHIAIFIWKIHSPYKDWLDLVHHISQLPFPVLINAMYYIMVSTGAGDMQ